MPAGGAIDIDGLGLATLQQLIQRELVQDPSDLYRLQLEQLVELDRFATKSAEKLFQRLQESRDRPLDRFLYALGIPQVGSATAELLAHEFNTLERLAEADEAELIRVEGVGASMAAEIHRFFAGAGGELARRLLDAGVRPQPVAAAPQGPLTGKTFVFTGSLERMSRPEAEELVRQLGGKATGGVSARTHYVVAGAAAGSKLEKAQRLKLQVLDEEAFFELLGR
ncbi:MAG: helix-hairpin-helix domain-containing protein [Candidatus Dormibacteraeota bacterium]|nr:helix-hairpin-helix domain-containing protein [Candidatus Dormibacteraeota bacterium]